MIDICFAPMEGMTDAVFRRVHHACFPGVKAYYIPFISPTRHLSLTNREKRNVLPEYNAGVPCVPQVLTKDAEHFLWAARALADMGYTEIDLNAGCPSGTVTAKGKGAGLLKDPDALDRLLDAVCAKSPLPVSVKTRIGWEDAAEWETLRPIYARYPLVRLIVHPRTCRERYIPGTIHEEISYDGLERTLTLNGDIFTKAEADAALARTDCDLMIGRGMVTNPALAREILGGEKLRREELETYLTRMREEMLGFYYPDVAFMKMRDVMKHIECCFKDTGKIPKRIRKARDMAELNEITKELLETCELKETPRFEPEGKY